MVRRFSGRFLVLDDMRRLLGEGRRGPVKRFGKLLNGVQRQLATNQRVSSRQPDSGTGTTAPIAGNGHNSATTPPTGEPFLSQRARPRACPLRHKEGTAVWSTQTAG